MSNWTGRQLRWALEFLDKHVALSEVVPDEFIEASSASPAMFLEGRDLTSQLATHA
jgi:hypothetical protein